MSNNKRFIHSITCEIELLVIPLRYFTSLAFTGSVTVRYCNVIKEQVVDPFASIHIS